MSREKHTFAVTVQIDFDAWRAEYGTEETNTEIIRAVQDNLLYAQACGAGFPVANPIGVEWRPEVTDADRLRFLNRRFFGQGDEDVLRYREEGRL